MAGTANAARVYVDGDVLLRLMGKRGIERPEELSATSGVSTATIYNLINGATKGSRLVRDALARALKVHPTELEG